MERCARSISPRKALVPSAGNGEVTELLDGIAEQGHSPKVHGETRRKGGGVKKNSNQWGHCPWPWEGWVGRLGTGRAVAFCPLSSLPLPSAPFPPVSFHPAGEEQSGDEHSQCHGSLCWDSHSAHGFWCH